jgi:hypothetical protein
MLMTLMKSRCQIILEVVSFLVRLTKASHPSAETAYIQRKASGGKAKTERE